MSINYAAMSEEGKDDQKCRRKRDIDKAIYQYMRDNMYTRSG